MSRPNPLEIPGHVTLADGNGGLRKVVVETPWSSAEIYQHGAHVTGFQKKGEEPLLFMSRSSEFAPGKAIRGGVPIIFPWFGGRDGLPAHGFARTTEWELEETSLLPDGSVTLRFRMPAAADSEVEYLVTVGEALAMELTVRNMGDKDTSFENCLHTYFQISKIGAVAITGLSETGYLDQLKNTDVQETSPAIHIAEEVDRIYFDTAATVEIEDPGFGRRIRVEKSGSLSTVVWNPWIEKSRRMPDFGDEEYLRMVCVESGNVRKNRLTLPPGERAVLRVRLSSGKL